MKKNKTVAYALAATLLVGGTFLGTKALFTDKVDVAGELKISTGDVDIEVKNQTDWILDRNGEESNTGTNHVEGSLDNIKPGDVLTKEITIKNAGTLIAEVNLVRNEEVTLGTLDGFLTLEETLDKGDNVDNLTLNPGQEKTVELKISANGPGLHNTADVVDGSFSKSYNTDDIEKTTVNLTSAWTLNAKQQDPKDTGFGR